jgi:hypothetical protein
MRAVSLGDCIDNESAQARWLKTVEVFNERSESTQLKLFASEVEPPANDPQVDPILCGETNRMPPFAL